jgi:hypothetical protein
MVEEAQSPFIEGTNIQFALDSTSLGAAKKCLRYYKQTIIDGWRRRDESVHLRWGGEFAKWLEFYHKCRAAGIDYEDALEETLAYLLYATFEWKSDHPTKNRETLVRSIIWYLDAYKDDLAKTLILKDGRPAVELSFKLELPWNAATGKPYILCGHIDRMIEYDDAAFVQDQKSTGGSLGAYYFKQFSPNGQMSGYTVAGKAIFDIAISGVMIDAVKVLVGSTEFARSFTSRTQGQLDEWLEDTRKWTGIIKFAAENDYWPMNENSCHTYDGCAFREVCSQDPKVRQSYLETYFHKSFWNPLEPRL